MYKKSYAKINYNLKVYEKMANGYHAMQSYMQKVSLYDEMNFEFKPNSELSLEVKVENDSRLDGPNNIVFQAAMLYCQHTQIKSSIVINIKKNIFLAAGLAGGSSNAATCLLALNEYFKAYTFEELLNLGKQLGSDVPFFLFDQDLMYVEGRGVNCKAEASVEKKPIVLVNPMQEVSTAKIYQALNRGQEVMAKERYFPVSGWQDLDKIMLQGNDMQDKAIALCPKIQDILSIMEQQAGCQHAQMSGSGATVWGLFNDEAHARASAPALKNVGKIIFTWTGTSSCFNRL
ncbi:4-(cytidine 5'-diphospho)-2-C-methyl-D-erythritol kinase [bacterium]|nr:4-(cytidine 5'-diphospho)-2-C-methyl-D-erythritol kinase [bacterium]